MRPKDIKNSSLPQAIELEMALLGTSLIDKNALDLLLDKLTEDDFYSDSYKEIFKTIKMLASKNRAVDIITVSNALEALNKDCGYELNELSDRIIATERIESYIKDVQDVSRKRQLIYTSYEIHDAVYSEELDIDSVIEKCEKSFYGAIERPQEAKEATMSQALSCMFDTMDRMRKGELLGISTGFKELDRLFGGFERQCFSIIAGRPSQGKTALMLSIINKISIINRVPCALFTIEMPRVQIAQRLTAAGAGLNLFKLRNMMLRRDEYGLVTQQACKMAEAPLIIDDSPILTANKFRSSLRRYIRQYGIQIAFIDHIHLMSFKEGDPVQGITNISKSLKATARDLDIPVVGLCQLSRKSVDRNKKDRRPGLQDLRGSGSLEQDADLVVFVHREYTYTKKEEEKNDAEIIIAKQRNGPIDTVPMIWNADSAEFKEKEIGDTGW